MSDSIDRAQSGQVYTRRLALTLFLTTLSGCNALSVVSHPNNPSQVDADPQSDNLATTPGKYSLRVPPCIFFSDFELKRDDPIFAELASLPDQVYQELHLVPRDAVVQVYLFEDEKKYHAYMKKKDPNLPERRAYFVEEKRAISSQSELKVYTFWGDRVQQDLRHEVTHALLHAVLRKVPIWLDEGLAEYFELPTNSHGFNGKHVSLLRRDIARGMPLDMSRLESLQEVSQMKQAEYRESWAWVYMMMHGKPTVKAVFLDYLKSLRTADNPTALTPKLAAVIHSPEDFMIQELASLDGESGAGERVQKTSGWFGEQR